MDKRISCVDGEAEYLVRWHSFTGDDDTWEPVSALRGSKQAIKDFEQRAAAKAAAAAAAASKWVAEAAATKWAAAEAAAAAEWAAPAPGGGGPAEAEAGKPSAAIETATAMEAAAAVAPPRGQEEDSPKFDTGSAVEVFSKSSGRYLKATIKKKLDGGYVQVQYTVEGKARKKRISRKDLRRPGCRRAGRPGMLVTPLHVAAEHGDAVAPPVDMTGGASSRFFASGGNKCCQDGGAADSTAPKPSDPGAVSRYSDWEEKQPVELAWKPAPWKRPPAGGAGPDAKKARGGGVAESKVPAATQAKLPAAAPKPAAAPPETAALGGVAAAPVGGTLGRQSVDEKKAHTAGASKGTDACSATVAAAAGGSATDGGGVVAEASPSGWQCLVQDDLWLAYPADLAKKIDGLARNVYLGSGPKSLEFSRHAGKGQSFSYRIIFGATDADVQQKNVVTGRCRPVRRCALNTARSVLDESYKPPEWEQHEENENCKLVVVQPKSPEWSQIVEQLQSSIPGAEMAQLLRVQNKLLAKKYRRNKDEMRDVNGTDPLEMWLWHGTGNLNPEVIYKDRQDGFDMRHAKEGKNLWGRGLYFAEKAAYSNNSKYAYMRDVAVPGATDNTGGYTELLLAKVLVGEVADMGRKTNRGLTMPPTRGGADELRYDTVKGCTTAKCGACVRRRASNPDCTSCTPCSVYVVYANGRAYPDYVVRYTVPPVDAADWSREDAAAVGVHPVMKPFQKLLAKYAYPREFRLAELPTVALSAACVAHSACLCRY
eukprot:COSAG01_NODE_2976_length_6765_cov_22.300480_4_plen_768_part_00